MWLSDGLLSLQYFSSLAAICSALLRIWTTCNSGLGLQSASFLLARKKQKKGRQESHFMPEKKSLGCSIGLFRSSTKTAFVVHWPRVPKSENPAHNPLNRPYGVATSLFQKLYLFKG